jgi:flavorubredoxin
MWHSTEKMAETIASAFSEKGYNYRLMSLQDNHISDIMTEIHEAEYICVGSPTLNKNMLPTVDAFLTYLKDLHQRKERQWPLALMDGEVKAKQVHEALESCGFTMLEPVSFKYIPMRILKPLGKKFWQLYKNEANLLNLLPLTEGGIYILYIKNFFNNRNYYYL